ncbi:MAG: TIR domain-containing protein, partial [Methylobacter sp.]|nr:TIR domain-containing protein [Methylobacter sp.]
DRDILPGEEWDKSIKEELRKADIVLYLVSADSMATDYIQQVELPMILQRRDAGECKLVPIIVRACDWEDQGFAKYNVLPMKGKPIKSWDDQDEAWLEVVKGIKKIID